MLLSGYRFVDIFFMEEVEVLFSVFFLSNYRFVKLHARAASVKAVFSL